MKYILFFLLLIICCSAQALAQEKPVKPLLKKETVSTAAQPLKMTTLQPEKPSPPPPVNTDLQSASVSFTTGDDGKDGDTKMGLRVWDNNKRAAASYNMNNSTFLNSGNAEEYFTGATNTVPMAVSASVPTGAVKIVGSLPLAVLRMAEPADFVNGGELRMDIAPNGHDTWKIKSITLHLGFNNDRNSPRTITWNNITLSQDSRYADLLFDKNFNPIQ